MILYYILLSFSFPTIEMFISRPSPALAKGFNALSTSAIRSASTYIFNWGIGTNFQLGHEKFDTEDSYTSGSIYRQKLPRRLVNSGRIEKMSFGEGYGIAMTSGAKLLAWGKDYPGSSTLGDMRTPTLVNTSFDVADVACGSAHCGAVDSNGHVYLWGDNGSRLAGGGQLGNSSYTPSATPVLVESLAKAGVKVKAVSCGEKNTIFLADDGTVYSCGAAEYGRLGHWQNWNADMLEPQQLTEVFGGERIIQVAAGFSHSLALTESGKVYSWGRNDQGQLGVNSAFIDMHAMESSPRHVDNELLENKTVVKIRAGKSLSGALTSDGELYHWGHEILPHPVRVMHEYPEDKIVDFAISGNGSNMCTAFVTESGDLYTVAPDSSTMLGRELKSNRTSSFFSSLTSLFGGGGGGDAQGAEERRENRVEALHGRVVHSIYGGFGEQMAVKVSGVAKQQHGPDDR